MLLNVVDSTRLLDKYGIPLPQWFCSNDRQELLDAARILRKPWALKLVSPDATHKTDKGLVFLNVRDENVLASNFDELQRKAAGLKVDCTLVQEQLHGTEFIVGGKKDASFGQTLLFGLGGTLTELYKDFALRVTPVDELEAKKMIAETKAAVFTQPEGFRGKKASEKALVDVLVKTSRLLEENPRITELDFNPVIANEGGAWVADARIVVENA